MIFTRSDDNKADMMTMNATRQEFEKHSPKWVDKVPEELLVEAKEKEGVLKCAFDKNKEEVKTYQ